MQDNQKELVPKGFLYGVVGMVLLSLLFVFSTSDSTGAKLVELEPSKVLGARFLNLTKLSDGSVTLSDLENEEIFNSRDGKSGFLSVIMTGLEYNRKKMGIELSDSYSVKLRRPTPVGCKLIVTSQIIELDGNKVKVELLLEANGKICATGEGLFVAVKEGHPAYHRWN